MSEEGLTKITNALNSIKSKSDDLISTVEKMLSVLGELHSDESDPNDLSLIMNNDGSLNREILKMIKQKSGRDYSKFNNLESDILTGLVLLQRDESIIKKYINQIDEFSKKLF